jgi:hypothetical protein
VQKYDIKYDVCNIVAREMYNIKSIPTSFITLYGPASADLHFDTITELDVQDKM